MKLKQSAILLCCLLSSCSNTGDSQPTAPKNVIFFIGDGMGFEQVKAAGMYANGAEGTLSFEKFSHRAELQTYPANRAGVTDSAAAATAMATGVKVNVGLISMAKPGDGSELATLLEYFQARQKATGLVSTAYITHATPAAFGSHELSRNNLSAIASDYLNQTRPNVLLGGIQNTNAGMTAAKARAAGYTVVTDRAGLQALDTNSYSNQSNTFVSGQFPGPDGNMPYEHSQGESYETLPHLSEMTAVALDILDNDADGFFLMVEGGRIDHAGHGTNIENNVRETVEFAAAVQVAINWAKGRNDTLIIVTADHETGGLMVKSNRGQGNVPQVEWSNGGHTEVNVPIYARGINAEMVGGIMNNTDLFKLATNRSAATAAVTADSR